MADVAINTNISGSATARGMRNVVFTTASIGYVFFESTTPTFVYRKTTDGGATWGANVTINATGSQVAFDVWFDQWTPGDTGTLIHLWYFDTTNDKVFWRSLDTNGDTLGTERTVFTGASAVGGRGAFCSGTKTRSGYLYVAYDIDAGAENGLTWSTDNGTTWQTPVGFVPSTIDQCLLFPATGTGDNNDMWAIYQVASTNTLEMKMWDSSAAAVVISASMQTMVENTTDGTGQMGFSGSVRHSDGHLIIVSCSEYDTATADMQAWEVGAVNAGSLTGITALTNITTNIDDNYNPSVFIDQITNDIYVAYNGKRDGSEVIGTTTKVYYTKSTDGGTTWSAGDTAYEEGATAVVTQVWTPLMGPRFCAVWRTGTTLSINKVNSVCLYRLVSTRGSYTLSGQTVGLQFGRKVAVTQGSYALSGQAVTLTKSAAAKILTVAQGSYSLSGQAVGLLFKRILSAVQGAYVLTGEAVSLLFGRKIAVTQGSYALTGQSVSLLFKRILRAAQGSYTLTGQSANLLFGRKMAASQGAYVLTGETVNLLFGRKLVAPQGSYVLTGEDATLLFGRKLSAVQGAYALSGQAVSLFFGRRITSATGLYVLTGEDVALSVVGARAIIFAIGGGSYVLTGENVDLIAPQAETGVRGEFRRRRRPRRIARWGEYIGTVPRPTEEVFIEGVRLVPRIGTGIIEVDVSTSIEAMVMGRPAIAGFDADVLVQPFATGELIAGDGEVEWATNLSEDEMAAILALL
jgi:hypothetical protein